jgi:tRNA (cmo5U34)-methyltransferase
LQKEFEHSPLLRINVLEIGTGTGQTSLEILKADPRIRLWSVDNERKMLEAAKIYLAEYAQSSRLEFIENDALSYLKKNSSRKFDGVVTSLTLHNFEKHYREKVLQQIFRILKVGGVFVNADKYIQDNMNIFQKEYKWQIQQFEKISDKKKRMAWIKHYETDIKPEIIMKEKESIETSKKIGFRNIKISKRIHLEALLTAKK